MESQSVWSTGRASFKRRGAAVNFAIGVRVSKRHERKCRESASLAKQLKPNTSTMSGLSRNVATNLFMNHDPRDPRRPDGKPKNPTRAVSVFIVVVVLLVIGTILFNAIREKREFDQQNAQPSAASDVRPAVPAIGVSQ